jgi:hypothetical protein
MKTSNLILSAIAVSLLMVNCKNAILEDIINPVKDVEVLENNILKFKDQASFDKYVEEERTIEIFYSLSNNFSDAMKEAESYYEREGGYEEFKK